MACHEGGLYARASVCLYMIILLHLLCFPVVLHVSYICHLVCPHNFYFKTQWAGLMIFCLLSEFYQGLTDESLANYLSC